MTTQPPNNSRTKSAGINPVRCRVLVPVDKLMLERYFKIGDFRFIPSRRDGDLTDTNNPLREILLHYPELGLPLFGRSSLLEATEGDNFETFVSYALIEFYIDIPEADLSRSYEYIDGVTKVLIRVTEQADKALDLLRFAYCNYLQI